MNRLPGRQVLAPGLTHHIVQMGEMLARMHLAGVDFPLRQAHLRGLDWWTATVPEVLPFVDAGRAALLRSELQFQRDVAESKAGAALPRGVIHADLFRDNAVFDDATGKTGSAGCSTSSSPVSTTSLFDLAVAINDWCIEQGQRQLAGRTTRAAAFCDAYQRVRPLASSELRLMPAMLAAQPPLLAVAAVGPAPCGAMPHCCRPRTPSASSACAPVHRAASGTPPFTEPLTMALADPPSRTDGRRAMDARRVPPLPATAPCPLPRTSVAFLSGGAARPRWCRWQAGW